MAAAIASFTGFACLAGWEFSAASSIVIGTLGISDRDVFFGMIFLSLIPALYTIRGGLRGNANINIVLNGIASIVILTCIVFMFVTYIHSGAITGSDDLITRLKLPLGDAIAGLGGVALATNLIFSLVWQSADMSTWENVSGSATSRRSVIKSLAVGGALVFVAPGLFGALLGMAVQHVPSITGDNILNFLISELAQTPLLGISVFASVLCIMLSTLDTHLLTASLSLTADVLFRGTAREYLRGERSSDAPEDRALEGKILTWAYVVILFTALFGIVLFSLVFGQMSLVPGVLAILLDKQERFVARANGLVSVLLALCGGWLIAIFSIQKLGPFGQVWLDSLPLITIGLGAIGLAVPRWSAAGTDHRLRQSPAGP
jgi:Na+/proline symporter